MDFDTLRKRAAKWLNMLDSNGDILTGKDVTEEAIGDAINDAYREDACRALMSQYPDWFVKKEYMASYTTSFTAETTSTGYTLVADSDVFSEDMLGWYVYNDTDNERATITSYTSATTVTLKSEIGNTWDGDTIRILDLDIPIGSTTDLISVRGLQVRYSVPGSGEEGGYVRATPRLEKDAIQSGYEEFSTSSPIYYPTSKEVSGVPTYHIRILPGLTVPDTEAIYITYLKIPSAMSGDTDVPHLPPGDHVFLAWRAVHDAAVQRNDHELAGKAEMEYEAGKRKMISNFRVTSFDEAVPIRVPRRVSAMSRRSI